MTKTIVEIAYDEDADGNLILAGDENEQAYEQIKPYLTAIEHNMDNGIASTLYRVDDDAPDDAVQAMIDASDDHTDHGVEEGVKRGLEIQPGTATSTEVDDLAARISDKVGRDVLEDVPNKTPAAHVWNDLPDDSNGGGPPSWAGGGEHPGADGPRAGKKNNGPPADNFKTVMKNDMPTIGEGNWLCLHPDHSSPEKNASGENCSLGHSDDITENDYAQQHRQPFDPSGFL